MAQTQKSINYYGTNTNSKSIYLLWLQFKTPYLLWYQLKCQYSLYSNNWVPESQTSSAISAGTKWAQKYNYIPNKLGPRIRTIKSEMVPNKPLSSQQIGHLAPVTNTDATWG